HRDDAASFMVFLVQKVLANVAVNSCYIVTDSKPTTQYEVLQWIAAQLGIECKVKVPVIEGGKRLSNQAMLATGFKPLYPDYQVGYQALLNQLNTSDSSLYSHQPTVSQHG
ncbi:MAG: SDR family NAD(P)-dependent oxidoreductase, partial [Methylotenera sp.]